MLPWNTHTHKKMVVKVKATNVLWTQNVKCSTFCSNLRHMENSFEDIKMDFPSSRHKLLMNWHSSNVKIIFCLTCMLWSKHVTFFFRWFGWEMSLFVYIIKSRLNWTRNQCFFTKIRWNKPFLFVAHVSVHVCNGYMYFYFVRDIKQFFLSWYSLKHQRPLIRYMRHSSPMTFLEYEL